MTRGEDLERGRVIRTAATTTVAGVLVLGLFVTALQIVSGRLVMADVIHRLPKPVAVLFVEDPDASVPLDCDGLDERDLVAVERYAGERGLEVVYDPPDVRPTEVAAVTWVHWRDRLVVEAGEGPDLDRPGHSGCPG